MLVAFLSWRSNKNFCDYFPQNGSFSASVEFMHQTPAPQKLGELAIYCCNTTSMGDDAAKPMDEQKGLSSEPPALLEHSNLAHNRVSEPMIIRVTMYSMEGIRRHDVATQKSTFRNRSHISPKRMTLKSTSTAPTTAIVSLRGQVVKTLVPSGALSYHELRNAERSVRGIASWQESNILDDVTRKKDEMPQSTFELSRNMRRQCFHRDARIDHMSQFLPEMVELVVGVAKGKEIFPLGIASIVVSGEEEGERLLNVPIKSFLVKNDKMSRTGRQKRGLIFDGDSYWYSLDNNAFMRVGICVIPRHNFIPKTMKSTEKANTMAETDEDNMFIELNDENSLIAQFKESEQTATDQSSSERMDEFAPGCYNMMFCGALGRWPEPARPPSSLTSEKKVMEAKVLSLRVVSDVSGSTVRWQMRQDQQEQQYDI